MSYLLISSIRAFPLLNILPILISSLLTHTALSDTDLNHTSSSNTYFYHNCRNSSGKYTKNSNYERNLNDALNVLKNETHTNKGFMNVSRGTDRDQVFTVALCRPDVSTGDCRACLVNVSIEITRQCPHHNAAILWREYCLLKYSNKYFYGHIDDGTRVLVWNWVNASNPLGFKGAALSLLGGLSKYASYGNNKDYMFAKGEIFDNANNVTLYGMAQCTRDLNPKNCSSCLDGVVKKLPWNITQAGTLFKSPVGGRTISGSCYVRYEIYQF